MRKYLLFILLLLIIPFFVYAEDCNDSKITIKDLTLKKSIGNTEELGEANLLNGKINLNLKMYEAEDSIEYTFKVKNESSEDYYMDSVIHSNHIEYVVTSNDNSLKIPVNGEKEFTLSVHYDGELEKTDFRGGKFDASDVINLSIIPDSIYNPKTGNYFFLILGVLLFVTFIMILTQNKKIRVVSIILALIVIPNATHAACRVNLELNSNIIVGYVVPNPCTYNGNLVQGAEFVSGQYTYRYMQEYGYNNSISSYGWNNSDTVGWSVILTDKSSTAPVTSKLCTSINDKPIVSMNYMFHNSPTTSIDTSSFDTSHVTTMFGMFYGVSSVEELELYTFDTSNVTDMTVMFMGCSGLSSLDVSSFDTSNVQNMASMFNGCSSLVEINMGGFDLSNSSSFSSIAGSIFFGTSSLKKIKMSYMKLPADMTSGIFRYGGAYNSPIEEIDVTGWDLSNTTNAMGMFGSAGSPGLGGTGLKRIIGLDTWDTSHITDMNQMFAGLSSLTTLDLSSFDTSNVTNMYDMFYNCTSLKALDLSNFDTSNVTNMEAMFCFDSQLETIYVSDSFVTNNVSSSGGMFNNCSSLVGENGTTFNSSYTDKTYARIDETGSPGYFTRKATS